MQLQVLLQVLLLLRRQQQQHKQKHRMTVSRQDHSSSRNPGAVRVLHLVAHLLTRVYCCPGFQPLLIPPATLPWPRRIQLQVLLLLLAQLQGQ
jgi:hypothetical protein